MLKTRIFTAIVLIPTVLALLYFLSPPAFCAFLSVIALYGAWEWTRLMGVVRLAYRVLYVIIMLLVLFNSLFIPTNFILYVGFIWWLVALLLVYRYPNASAWWAKSVLVRGLMGIVTIVPCWASFNYIRNQEDGFYAIVFLLFLICGADSVAYFVGKAYGKHKLAPLVSPGKSVEGVLGALMFAAVVAMFSLWLTRAPMNTWGFAVALCVVTVAFSVVGDLFESMLKRNVNLKDSGQLLPGHGGLLDRMDSLMAGVPMFAFGATAWATFLRY